MSDQTKRPADGPVRITTREIYETLLEVKTLVEGMLTREDDFRQQLSDHELRIRKNEAWRYGLPLALLTSIASIVLTLLN